MHNVQIKQNFVKCLSNIQLNYKNSNNEHKKTRCNLLYTSKNLFDIKK